jgi:macrolide transport system ATP-binding/permease protein
LLVFELSNIKKYIGGRLILDIDRLSLYVEDRIGLVGLNGSGKTTLLNIIAERAEPDDGRVQVYGSWEYITQLDEPGADNAGMSGGEITLAKINAAMADHCHFLLADEPTGNLSLKRVEELTKRLRNADCGMLIISHDRMFLNDLCDKIIELENGRLKEYAGNYDFYKKAKALEDEQRWEAYNNYTAEKRRLTESMRRLKEKAKGMKHAPKRMGNSEARLYKGEIKQRAGDVARAAKIIESRAGLLEEVKKPVIAPSTCITPPENRRLYSKIAVEGRNVYKAFGSRVILRNTDFIVTNPSKTALLGENGAGKTTLLRMILDGDPSIRCASGLKPAYFTQNLDILDPSKSVLDNVVETSAYSQAMCRGLLARMLFFGEDVFKKASVLSGGERVKAALCKIFASDVNMLILDEPNNYLDLSSMDALESMIRDYKGCLLIVTHDRSLMNLADRLLILENKEIHAFQGDYWEYTERLDS